MCGADDAVCLHGDCAVKTLEGEAVEYCKCYAMYSGSQCSFRSGLLYWELLLAGVMMLVLLLIEIFVTGKTLKFLRFREATKDEFASPRGLIGSRRKGLPTKPAKGHLVENLLIVLVIVLELLPWVQMTALAFLPVVPWPKASRGIGEILQHSLLYPLWSHLEPSRFPRLMLYISLGFVPGAVLTACVLGWKRFPLFKPQPKSAPSEDLCTIVLRLHSDWIALPIMIGLLLPLECVVIGSGNADGAGMALGSCFTLWQGGLAVAGFVMLLVYCVASSVIVLQLNCEGSAPEPTLWTHVRYTRTAHAFKAPLAMSVVASVNANAPLLCGSCLVVSLILGVLNVRMKPCVHSLVNGLRVAGATMSTWSSLLALVAFFIDDPGVTVVYEAWSLGAIAISVISFSGLLLYHTEDFWHQLADSAPVAKSSKANKAAAGTSPKEVTTPATKQTAKVAAVGFRARLLQSRRSSAAEKLRSRSQRGSAAAAP